MWISHIIFIYDILFILYIDIHYIIFHMQTCIFILKIQFVIDFDWLHLFSLNYYIVYVWHMFSLNPFVFMIHIYVFHESIWFHLYSWIHMLSGLKPHIRKLCSASNPLRTSDQYGFASVVRCASFRAFPLAAQGQTLRQHGLPLLPIDICFDMLLAVLRQ